MTKMETTATTPHTITTTMMSSMAAIAGIIRTHGSPTTDMKTIMIHITQTTTGGA